MLPASRLDASSSPDAASSQSSAATPSSAPTGPAGPEQTITVVPHAGEARQAFFERLASTVRAAQGTVLAMFVWGSLANRGRGMRLLRACFGEISWPVTWVEGASCFGDPIAGIQVFLQPSDHPVRRIAPGGGHVLATVYEDGSARHCLLGGLGPRDTALPRPHQARQVFENLVSVLDAAGFALGDVARTWFFNDDLLTWYGEFNRVRTAVYAGVPWRSGSLPASTGVAGSHPANAALAVAAWAVQPLAGADPTPRIREVASPLQCPAPSYGSSFSRAMEIESGGLRRLLVSGTASIGLDGRSVGKGDIRKQIDLTMRVVEAILRSREMTFADAKRATAYFKHAADAPAFAVWLATHGMAALPVVPVHCEICRDDLLFEVEVDACRR
jgi:enamine deaminase RidA (YjgF/YER057c/UK114 family)